MCLCDRETERHSDWGVLVLRRRTNVRVSAGWNRFDLFPVSDYSTVQAATCQQVKDICHTASNTLGAYSNIFLLFAQCTFSCTETVL